MFIFINLPYFESIICVFCLIDIQTVLFDKLIICMFCCDLYVMQFDFS